MVCLGGKRKLKYRKYVRGRALCRMREPLECALPMATGIAAVGRNGRRPADGKRSCAGSEWHVRVSCQPPVHSVPNFEVTVVKLKLMLARLPIRSPARPDTCGAILQAARTVPATSSITMSIVRVFRTPSDTRPGQRYRRNAVQMPLCRCQTLGRPVVRPRALQPH
jgi:hypothetical protein